MTKSVIQARLPAELDQYVTAYCNRTGLTRSAVMITALAAYFEVQKPVATYGARIDSNGNAIV